MGSDKGGSIGSYEVRELGRNSGPSAEGWVLPAWRPRAASAALSLTIGSKGYSIAPRSDEG